MHSKHPKTGIRWITSSATVSLPLKKVKIMAENLVVDTEDPPTTSLVQPKPCQYGLTYVPSRQEKAFDDISSVLALSSQSRLDLSGIHNVTGESLNTSFPHKLTPHYKFG